MVTILFTFRKKHYLLIIFALILYGCTFNNNSGINKKKTQLINTHASRINLFTISNPNYQENKLDENYFEPLFEDYKPRNVGDMLTVILQENMSASNSVSNNSIHNGNSNIGIIAGNSKEPNLEINNKLEFNTSIKNNFLGKGSSFANNQFIGLITVTVDKILSNGNLEVSGEKNIILNEGKEKIHFYGIINPRTISKNNSVLSTQIANTDIKYISSGPINQGSKINWLQRLFLGFFTLSK